MRVAITGARGTLGSALMPLLGRDAVPIDRADGLDIDDTAAMTKALAGCEAIVHLAGLHPLIARSDATADTYRAANVTPFVALLAVARQVGVSRVVFASTTSVWSDQLVRIVDEDTGVDGTSPYAASKRACEGLLVTSGLQGVRLRLSKFARPDDPGDDVRKLYRAVDVRDAATAVQLALERAPRGSVYAISAPTPFDEGDLELLASDPRAAIVRRTGRDPAWAPARVGAVVNSARATRDLGWTCAYPSTFLIS